MHEVYAKCLESVTKKTRKQQQFVVLFAFFFCANKIECIALNVDPGHLMKPLMQLWFLCIYSILKLHLSNTLNYGFVSKFNLLNLIGRISFISGRWWRWKFQKTLTVFVLVICFLNTGKVALQL